MLPRRELSLVLGGGSALPPLLLALLPLFRATAENELAPRWEGGNIDEATQQTRFLLFQPKVLESRAVCMIVIRRLLCELVILSTTENRETASCI